MSCGSCNAGKLRHRIALQAPSYAKDSYGEEIVTYTTYATVWASVRPMQGKELMHAQQMSATVTHKIRIRYNSAIKPTDRILFDSREFEIEGVLNWEERNIWQDILANEVVDG